MFIDFSGLVCFDLETTSSHRTLDEMGESNPRMVDLWNTLCEKRKKAGDERFIESSSNEESYFNNAGLYPEFGRIVNASFAMYNEQLDGPGTIQIISIGGENERDIIESANKMFGKSSWIAGHNAKGFDVPFFSRRAYINRIHPNDNIDTTTKKPWDVRILDTQDIWKFGSFNHSYTSLDLLTTSLGMESPKLEHFGAHVSKLFWDDKDYEEIAKYCEGDVISTLKVLIRFSNVSINLDQISVDRKPMRPA